MNMMVNTSELVGSEAEIKRNSETALKSALSKLVASWEKKQATRFKKVGGFGLLAVSLAACNSSSDDTATTTTTPTTPATPATPAAPTVNNVTIAAATLNNFGKAGENDVYAATETTLTSTHKIIDADTTDEDVLNVTLTGDFANTPTVLGIETVNFTTAASLSGGDTTLDVNVQNIEASGDTITFDVTSATSLVAALDLDMAGTNHYSVSSELVTVTIGTQLDADVTLTIAADTAIVVDNGGAGEGIADDLTINGGTAHDVTLTSSTASEDVVITGLDVVVTAADSAAGNMTITAAGDATITSLDELLGNITITAGDDTTITEAPKAAGTITVTSPGVIAVDDANLATGLVLNNTGGTSGEDINLGDTGNNNTGTAKVTTATITSIGAIDASEGTGLNVGENITLTAAEDSTLSADNPANTQTINLNSDSSGVTNTPEVTFTVDAANVTTVNLGGATAVEMSIAAGDITAKTVASTNTAGASVLLTGIAADVDATKIATDVSIRLSNPAANTITAAAGQSYFVDAEATYNNAGSDIAHTGTATSGSTSLTLNLGVYDSDTTNADKTATLVGFKLSNANNVIIDTGSFALNSGTADIIADDADTITIKGAGTGTTPSTLNMGVTTFVGNGLSTTPDVVVDASQATGTIEMGMTSTANATTNVTTGSGGDTIHLVSQATGDTFTVKTNAGNDTFDLDAAGNFTFDGGTGVDTLLFANDVDLDASTFTLTSVEVIDVTGKAGASSSKINASAVSGKTFILKNTTTDNAALEVVADQVTIDLSNLSPDTTTWGALDQVTVAAGSMGLASTITGHSAIDVITAGGGADTISAGGGADTVNGGGGADVIKGEAGDDTLNGDAGADTITGGEGADTINGGAAADSIVLTETTAANDIVQIKDSTTIDTITGFTVGASKDQVEISISVNGNISAIVGGNATDDAHTKDIVLKTVTGKTTAGATDNIFVLAGDLADTAAVKAAIIDGAAQEITLTAKATANDDILVLYDDGTKSHLAIVNINNAEATIDNNAGSTVTNLVTFSDIADSSTFDATNFDLIA